MLDTPRRVVVGSATAQQDGTFRAKVVVPVRASAGAHKLQVVGTAPSGRPMSLAARLIVTTPVPVAVPVPGLAEPVLLTLAAAIPLATWLVLEVLGSRSRRFERRAAPPR